jgi:hypothetical protein
VCINLFSLVALWEGRKMLFLCEDKYHSILHDWQAWELISGPCLGAKARFLSFNRTQSRAVTGLFAGHNTLRRHLHLMGLSDTLFCRRCGAENETSAQILCECETSSSLWYAYLVSFFLEPEDIKSISLGAIWNYSKATGLPWIYTGHKGPVN